MKQVRSDYVTERRGDNSLRGHTRSKKSKIERCDLLLSQQRETRYASFFSRLLTSYLVSFKHTRQGLIHLCLLPFCMEANKLSLEHLCKCSLTPLSLICLIHESLTKLTASCSLLLLLFCVLYFDYFQYLNLSQMCANPYSPRGTTRQKSSESQQIGNSKQLNGSHLRVCELMCLCPLSYSSNK